MNKSELITKVSEKCDFTKKDASKALEAFMESIKESVSKGDKVTLIGFGSFEPRKRPAHKGRSPQTGIEIAIPASTYPVFKAGKDFKVRVNK
ncbi:DNA-binding protein HU [Oxobacter pfennigii]|uniref:DNA-binding protein HU n=1 Tax=Oxobacter pfennigii TaxID=36849 RepID=A0A0P8X1P1_9CLOT|nr:HU family DNA-binding protein [Oxobacter pfennigii]KPU44731.1 DNA-binding protein HU [Oxobacter pfennigii]